MHLSYNFKLFAAGFCLWLSGFSVAGQTLLATDSTNFKTLRIDPLNARGGDASDFFEEINYIPLETTPESLFGSISQLEVTEDYYIIRDENTNSILLFTKAGKFHAKISGKRDITERMNTFVINKWTKQILCASRSYRIWNYYNFDGNLIKTRDIKDAGPNEATFSDFQFFSRDKAIAYNDYYDLEFPDKKHETISRALVYYVDNLKYVYAGAIPKGKDEGYVDVLSAGIGPLTNSGNDTTFFFSKPYDYSIYSLGPNSVKLSYKFLFPLAASLPADFLTNAAYNEKRIEFVEKHKAAVYCLNNFYQTGDNLLFEASAMSNWKEDNLIYNLKSGSLIAFKHVSPDSLSSFLPLYSSYTDRGFFDCDGSYVYTTVSSLEMFKAYDENKDKNVKYKQVLADYFAKQDKKDNPVILQIKLKKSL